MKKNDIVEVYPFGYHEDVYIEFRRVAIVLDVLPLHRTVIIKFTDKEREHGTCVRDKQESVAYCINNRKDVWYAIKVISE